MGIRIEVIRIIDNKVGIEEEEEVEEVTTIIEIGDIGGMMIEIEIRIPISILEIKTEGNNNRAVRKIKNNSRKKQIPSERLKQEMKPNTWRNSTNKT